MKNVILLATMFFACILQFSECQPSITMITHIQGVEKRVVYDCDQDEQQFRSDIQPIIQQIQSFIDKKNKEQLAGTYIDFFGNQRRNIYCKQDIRSLLEHELICYFNRNSSGCYESIKITINAGECSVKIKLSLDNVSTSYHSNPFQIFYCPRPFEIDKRNIFIKGCGLFCDVLENSIRGVGYCVEGLATLAVISIAGPNNLK